MISRPVFFSSWAALLLVLLGSFPRQILAQEKIRLAHSALESSNSVWYLAKERGLYKKYGLDADLLFIPSTTTSVSSLVAGDVQVGNASGGGVASAWEMFAPAMFAAAANAIAPADRPRAASTCSDGSIPTLRSRYSPNTTAMPPSAEARRSTSSAHPKRKAAHRPQASRR